MDYKVFIPVLISFVLSVILGPLVIPVLRRLKMDQTEREDGVQSHLKKTGTPTMGGVMILLAVVITSVIYIGRYPKIIPILFLTLGFGLIGFLDDYLKVVMKRSDGLYPKQKMALQIVVTAIFAFYMVKFAGVSLTMLIPFTGGKYLDIGWVAIPLMFFVVIGTVNGVNFTDGLDGLAASVTTLIAAAYMLQMPIFIIIVGFIYLIEVLSVMIQVTYFKKTGGKRIFKMAPIHHHFELCGWSETRVVAVFSIITAILCLIALMAM